MSFVRRGYNGSDLYIYDDVTHGPVCCDCNLLAKVLTGGTQILTPDNVREHFDAHLAAGDGITFAYDDLEAFVWDCTLGAFIDKHRHDPVPRIVAMVALEYGKRAIEMMTHLGLGDGGMYLPDASRELSDRLRIEAEWLLGR